MGFLDKVKGAFKAVTGTAAKVTMEYSPSTAIPGDVVKVKISATSTGGEVKSKGVFVDLRGNEEVFVKSNKSDKLSGDLRLSAATLEQAFQISPAFVLAANETKHFEGTFSVPVTAQPSYAGAHTNHNWQVRGRVEALGNDPDTGYLPLRVGTKL